MADEATRSDLIDLAMVLHHQTDKAILVSEDGNRDKALWLAKQHVEFAADKAAKSRNVVIVTMPGWLAENKRLI